MYVDFSLALFKQGTNKIFITYLTKLIFILKLIIILIITSSYLYFL